MLVAGLRLLSIDERKVHWTAGLKQMCQLLEQHQDEAEDGVAKLARGMHCLVLHSKGKVDQEKIQT